MALISEILNQFNDLVANGFGINIRQHDDVMLAYGYSRATRVEQTLTTGQFMVLRLDVNTVKLHHAESREISSSAGSFRVKLYDATGNENLFPATPTQMPIYNKNGLVKETPGVDVMAEFNSYPVQASDPFAALDVIENKPIQAPVLGGPVKAGPTAFEGVKGRHYTPDETYALVLENTGPETSRLYYQYDWHEIPVGGAY